MLWLIRQTDVLLLGKKQAEFPDIQTVSGFLFVRTKVNATIQAFRG